MAIDRKLLPEIATTRDGRDITRGYVDALPLLPPTDRILPLAGGWRGYEELLRDDQVAATFAQRRLAVVSRPWTVDPGGERRIDRKAADQVRATLDRLDWDSVTDQMLHARFYGYAVAEVIWAADRDGVRVQDLRVRDRERFGFAPDGGLRLRTTSNPNGEPLPDRKFWVASVGASHHDEPYGRGLAHQLYWPVWFKRQGSRFWSVFLEKFGAPTVIGRFPAAASKEDQDKLLQAVQAVTSDSGMVLPEGMIVELLEAARAGNAGYETWMRYWDAAISKVVVGQTMTTDDGSSRAQAEVHMDVRTDIVRADADLVCASANRSWVRWLTDLTLPGAAYPRIWRDLEQAEDLDSRAERDVKLHGLGIRLRAKAVPDVYGDQYELVREQDAPDENAGAEPAAPDRASAPDEGGTDDAARVLAAAERAAAPDAEELIADRFERDSAGELSAWMRAIEQEVARADSLAALRERLLALFADLEDGKLARVMQLGLAAADLAGRFEAAREAGQIGPAGAGS